MGTLPDRPLRVDEVAEYWSVTVRTVYLWIEHGKLTIAPTPSGAIRVTRESVISCPLGNRSNLVT